MQNNTFSINTCQAVIHNVSSEKKYKMYNPGMDDINLIIQKRMKELGITQEVLAERIGVTQGQVGHYVTGFRKPSLSRRKMIEKELKLPRGTLVFSETDGYSSISGITKSLKTCIADNLNHGNIPKFSKSNEIRAWISNPILSVNHMVVSMPIINKKYSNSIYAYEVVGSAMVNRTNPEKSIFPGERAFIDPEGSRSDGDLVLVEFGPDDLRIRQFREDGAHKSLHAFAQDIDPVTLTNEIKILGVIIESARSWSKE